MKKAFFICVFIAAIVGSASANCEDPDRSCLDKLDDAAKDLKASESFSDAWNNAKAVGSAVKDCVNCGMENVESGMKKLTPNGNGK